MPGTLSNELPVRVTTIRKVPQEDVERAREIIVRVLAHAPRPILDAKVTLNVLPDPAIPRPNLVSFRIDLNGLAVTAYAAAASMPEAINLAGARLRARIAHLIRYREAHRKAHHNAASAD